MSLLYVSNIAHTVRGVAFKLGVLFGIGHMIGWCFVSARVISFWRNVNTVRIVFPPLWLLWSVGQVLPTVICSQFAFLRSRYCIGVLQMGLIRSDIGSFFERGANAGRYTLARSILLALYWWWRVFGQWVASHIGAFS